VKAGQTAKHTTFLKTYLKGLKMDWKNKDISETPAGVTGYTLQTREDHLEACKSSGIDLYDSSPIEAMELTYAWPPHCNPLPFIKVKDQQRMGACGGFALAQVGEGCNWVKTNGGVQRYSGAAMYFLAQEKGGLRGDVGSVPSDLAWVARNIGLVPQEICPPDPPTYQQRFKVTQAMRDAGSDHKLFAFDLDGKPDAIKKFLTGGIGYVMVGSIWPAHFDRGGKSPITTFQGQQRGDVHGGGHAYALMGWHTHPQHGFCYLLVNSWNVSWGDDGARLLTEGALIEMLKHKFTRVIGFSDQDPARPRARKVIGFTDQDYMNTIF